MAMHCRFGKITVSAGGIEESTQGLWGVKIKFTLWNSGLVFYKLLL
jgi:hypothetical protein